MDIEITAMIQGHIARIAVEDATATITCACGTVITIPAEPISIEQLNDVWAEHLDQ